MTKPVLKEGSVVTIPIDSITKEVYVRKTIDQDNVVRLWMLIEGGADLDPITVTTNWVLVKGNHRIAAYLAAGLKECKAKIIKENDRGELLITALKDNIGGGLPASTADIKNVILQLMGFGWSKKKMVEHLPFPPVTAERYIRDTQLLEKKERIRKGVEYIVQGYTIHSAAKESGSSELELKQALDKAKKGKIMSSVNSRKGQVSNNFKGLTGNITRQTNILMAMFEDGMITEIDMWDFLNHAHRLSTGLVNTVIDHKKRFEADIHSRNNLSKTVHARRELEAQ